MTTTSGPSWLNRMHALVDRARDADDLEAVLLGQRGLDAAGDHRVVFDEQDPHVGAGDFVAHTHASPRF